jgi:DNA-binding NarL/FixJ family response regulator
MTAPALPRAIVVEDDHAWQQIMGEILADCGLEVDVAGSLEEALPLLKKHSHRLAVADLSLSANDHNNTDGLQVLENIKNLDPECKSILLTGFATVEVAVAALTRHNAFTFLQKESFNRGQFKEIIHSVLTSAPKAEEEKVVSVSQPIQPSAPAALKALIVDDDAGWRSILEDLLNDLGFQPALCASFGEALGALRKGQHALAIIDLSLNEPLVQNNDRDPNGYQLLGLAQERKIPTIVISGLSEPDEIQRIYSKYSIAAYIEKQAFDRATFKRIIEDTKNTPYSDDKLGTLTEREREVLDLLAQGLTNKEIADKLVITTNTVKRHLKAIFEKLEVHTRSAATAKVTRGSL